MEPGVAFIVGLLLGIGIWEFAVRFSAWANRNPLRGR